MPHHSVMRAKTPQTSPEGISLFRAFKSHFIYTARCIDETSFELLLSRTAIAQVKHGSAVLLVLLICRSIRHFGFFFAFGHHRTKAIFFHTKLGQVRTSRLGAAFPKADVEFACSALVGMACDHDLLVFHLGDASDVFFQGLFCVAANKRAVVVVVYFLQLTSIFDALAVFAFFARSARLGTRTTTGALSLACSRTCRFADLLTRAVRVLSAWWWFVDALMAFADFADIPITRVVAIVFADPLASQRRRIAAFSARTSDVATGLLDALVAFAFLAITAIFFAATFLTLSLDTKVVFLCSVAFFVGTAMLVAITFGPWGLTGREHDPTHTKHRQQQPPANERRKIRSVHVHLLVSILIRFINTDATTRRDRSQKKGFLCFPMVRPALGSSSCFAF